MTEEIYRYKHIGVTETRYNWIVNRVRSLKTSGAVTRDGRLLQECRLKEVINY